MKKSLISIPIIWAILACLEILLAPLSLLGTAFMLPIRLFLPIGFIGIIGFVTMLFSNNLGAAGFSLFIPAIITFLLLIGTSLAANPIFRFNQFSSGKRFVLILLILFTIKAIQDFVGLYLGQIAVTSPLIRLYLGPLQ